MDFLPIVEQTIQEIMEEIIEVANGKGFMALASIITVLGGISPFTGIVNKLLNANGKALVKRKPNEMLMDFIYPAIIYVMDLFSWILMYVMLFVIANIGIFLLDFSQTISSTKCIYLLFLGLLVVLFGVYINNRNKKPLNFIESFLTTIFLTTIFAIIFSIWINNVNAGYAFLASICILLIVILWWSDIKYRNIFDKENMMLKVLSTSRITVLVFSYIDMTFITKVATTKKIMISVVVWDLVAATNYLFRNILGKQKEGDIKIIDTTNGQFVSREKIIRKKNGIVEFHTTSYEKYFMDSKEICSIKYNIYNRRRRKRLFYIWTCKQKTSEMEDSFDEVKFINDNWVKLVTYMRTVETVTVVPRDKIDYIKRERRK